MFFFSFCLILVYLGLVGLGFVWIFLDMVVVVFGCCGGCGMVFVVLDWLIWFLFVVECSGSIFFFCVGGVCELLLIILGRVGICCIVCLLGWGVVGGCGVCGVVMVDVLFCCGDVLVVLLVGLCVVWVFVRWFLVKWFEVDGGCRDNFVFDLWLLLFNCGKLFFCFVILLYIFW